MNAKKCKALRRAVRTQYGHLPPHIYLPRERDRISGKLLPIELAPNCQRYRYRVAKKLNQQWT